MQDAYLRGRDAALDGYSPRNPYQEGTKEYYAYRKGYRAGRNQQTDAPERRSYWGGS